MHKQIINNSYTYANVIKRVHMAGPGQAKGAKGLDGFRLHVVLSIHSFHLKPTLSAFVGGGKMAVRWENGKTQKQHVATGSALINSSQTFTT